MKHIFTTLTILLTNIAFSQSTISVNEYSLQSLNAEIGMIKFDENSTNKNEYFSIEFNQANVSGFKEKEKLRYNALKDQFEFLRDGYLYKVDKINDQQINFDNGTIFKNVTFIQNDNLDQRYLQALSNPDKKNVLYKKYTIDQTKSLSTNGFNQATGADAYGNRFTKDESLVIWADGYLYPFSKNTKKLSQILQVDVDSIIKANSLNLKKESDIVKLFEIINK